MAEQFTPITSQEEFDSMIKSRLEREANKVRNEFSDYEQLKTALADKTKEAEELSGRISGFESQIAELNKKVTDAETDSVKTRIVHELGLPFELKSRLTGTTEEEIRKDAEGLKQFFNTPPAPLFNPEHPAANSLDAAYKQVLQGLNFNE